MKKYGNATSECIYHIAFSTRYRRKIFLIDGLEAFFQRLVQIRCKELNVEILELLCKEDIVILSLNCPPEISPAAITGTLKNTTSKILRNQFNALSKMPSLWTNNYLAATRELTGEEIMKFASAQKKHS